MSTVRSKSAALRGSRAGLPPGVSRPLLVLAVAAGGVGGALWTGPEAWAMAVAAAGEDLTRLLRAMAALKLLGGAVAAAVVFWRLGRAAGAGWLLAYCAAGAAMAAGPGLIWGMAHVGAGALLLHAGLFATLGLLWRDPVTGQRIAAAVVSRRARLAG